MHAYFKEKGYKFGVGYCYITLKVLNIAGMVFSFILSICLYELLKYIFAPLEKISSVSKKIAEGKYKEKLDIKGGNE